MSFLAPDGPRGVRRQTLPRLCLPPAFTPFRAVTVLLVLGFAYAALAAPGNRLPQIPQIRVSTRLVKMGVIARDRNGAVTNLTANDLVVLDRGKRREVSFFSLEANSSAGRSLVVATLPLTRNTFSHVPQHGAAQPTSVTVVLLDNLNTLTGGAPLPYETTPFWLEDLALANAKQHLVAVLKQADPNDRIAIYGLSGSLHVLCDFTCGRDQLLAVVSKYDPSSRTLRESAEPGNFHTPVPGNFNPEVDEEMQRFAAINNEVRAQTTMAALGTIARHVADIPGRKNLVWLTANLPFSGQAIARILSRANIVAYPIDARGLLPRSPQETREGMDDAAKYVFGTHGGPPAMSAQPIGVDAMEEMADDTGGRAFVNTNDLTGAIRQAIEDSDVTYTIGFYIGQDSIDGKFHPLKIEVKRKGVTLRYPKGYFAFEDTPVTKDENRENLIAAVRSPIESSMIPVHVRIERVEKPLPHSLRIFGSIDVRKLQFAQNGRFRKDAVDVVTIEQDQTGKVVAQSASTISFRFSDKEYEDYLKTGFPFHQFVQPKKGASTVRILVEDTSTAEVGSLIIPLSDVK
ncbi:MAG: VWA domain-containing protein [Candidatus Acidiferrales bacterium]